MAKVYETVSPSQAPEGADDRSGGQERFGPGDGEPANRRAERLRVLQDWAIALTLLLLVFGAGYVRGALIWPATTGLQESPYDDEGVYAAAAQLMLQGKHPYRDFIYAHPPLGPILLLPAIDYHFTAWGSPITLLLLRYSMTLYGALTVGLVFLLAWRLWGFWGGLLSGAILACDPSSVWAGRHVMLEAPLLFLMALAALLYVVSRGQEREGIPLSLAAGFLAAAAGGVKLQGLVLLAALLIDLTVRRRWTQLASILAGATLLWLPLWGYLLFLRGGNPLGQFVWLQLLRPADGLVSSGERLRQLRDDGGLALAGAALALLALPAFGFRPLSPLRRQVRRVRAARRAGRSPLQLPRLSSFDGVPQRVNPEPSRGREPGIPPAAVAPSPGVSAARRGLNPGWSLLPWWLLLTGAALLLSRSFYAHYGAHLALPLAILAGAAPAAAGRAVRSGWAGRAVALAIVVAGAVLLFPLGSRAVRTDFRARPNALYQIVGRYAGDAVKPEQGVFALDAQFPFRAARRPAREDRDRFIVDGYGMLLYHGLGIEGTPMLELARRAATQRPPTDPYQIMWRPRAQEQLRASMARSDLVVIDKGSDGRLADETRAWLATQGKLEEKQDAYAIYRITRQGSGP